MKRFFNTTGLCNPEKHYMVDPFRTFYGDILRLIEAEQYFLIHAPGRRGRPPFSTPWPTGSTGRETM
ncbi:MAG: hypothetical protein IPK21_21185 [Haliscomenobacter sp.]|nr:hypothetical protein [Haliscomenobacter sp.]